MKTFSGWTESRLCLSAYLVPGDRVDGAILDYVRDTVPPIRSGDWLALGEPFSRDSMGRPTYLAFYENFYRGPLAVEQMTWKLVPDKMFLAATDAAEQLRAAYDSGDQDRLREADREYIRLTDEMWWRDWSEDQRKEWSEMCRRLDPLAVGDMP
jgi:hypothetical protein